MTEVIIGNVKGKKMVDRKDPNSTIEGIQRYRASQTGWRVDSTSRGPRVDLSSRMRQVGDVFYDKLFAAINSGLHPIDALRYSSTRTKLGLAGTAALLAGGAGVSVYLDSPEHQTPQGVAELSTISKNVDGRWGVEEARVSMYLEEMPGVFSPSGAEQLRKAALQSDSPPFIGGGDLEKTQRGLDALIVVSQVIDAHDLGEGRFLEFHDEELEQLKERLGDFVGSGLASDEIKRFHETGDIEGAIVYLQNLSQSRDAALATLEGREITELPSGPVAGQGPGIDPGR